jgi:2-hydroxycyclohexanecarboxyl-CoA dehydrogenase
MFKLSDKVAIVTGGARGIGKGIVIALAKQGADVVIADLLMAEAKATISEIEFLGRKVTAIKCDVTKKKEVDETTKNVLKTFGKVNILVNNVGWDKVALFVQTTPDFWDKSININYKSVLNFTRAVLDHMMERNYGRIINIGSDAGRIGLAGEAVYSGTKGAVIAFTKALAKELAPNKITVNCICPGPTETPRAREIVKESDLAVELSKTLDKTIPLGRIGKPKDIAAAVAFLASDEAEFVTGQTFSVSGGLVML